MAVDVLDPDLPFLASRAAVELDAILNGESTEKPSVEKLAERLRESLDEPDSPGAKRGLLIDTATETVLGQALNLADSGRQLSNLEDLRARTGEIAEQLSKPTSGQDSRGLELARAFCLALSRCAAAYRKSVYDIRQPHPFRR